MPHPRLALLGLVAAIRMGLRNLSIPLYNPHRPCPFTTETSLNTLRAELMAIIETIDMALASCAELRRAQE